MASTDTKIKDDIAKLDLYAILGVSHDVTEKMIVKAYRKKALKCHPDKNPDNPAAIELFHQLSKALEILTDQAARAAYDKIQKAKKAAELRLHELGSKRRKLREDLEAREKAAVNQSGTYNNISAAAKLEAEILRLRKEGSRLVQEEQQRLQEEIKQNANKVIELDDDSDTSEETPPPRLKIKWKAKKTDLNNGGYSKDILQKVFENYGGVNALLLSMKKKGSAVVEFASVIGAQLAFEDGEIGLSDNPLTLTWLTGKPDEPTINKSDPNELNNKNNTADLLSNDEEGSQSSVGFNNFSTSSNSNNVTGFSFNSTSQNSASASDKDDGNVTGNQTDSLFGNSSGGEMDFESLVFMRMRQAQERKRLAEEMTDTEVNEKASDTTFPEGS